MEHNKGTFENVDNLNTKKITEFTKEDTIYIQIEPERGHPQLVLCFFEKYKNGIVYGNIISFMTNPKLYDMYKGTIIKAKLAKCALYGSAVHEDESIKKGFYHWFDALGRALDPRSEYKIVESELHIKKHPSFGMIGFSRMNSSESEPLFGSSIQSKQMIVLRIHTAEHDRDLNHDWYHANKMITEVMMNQSQFAELITSFNMGNGIPCTIKSFNGEQFAYPPFVSKVDMFKKEFANNMHNLGVDIEKLGEDAIDILKNKKTINKGDREVILDQMRTLLQNVQSNIPYVSKQFMEQMEKTVTEAKCEIEAFVNNKINTLGIEALREEMGVPQIEKTQDTDYKEIKE